MIGFPDLQRFALIYDEEKGLKASSVMWLQSMDDTQVAFPVMQPNQIKPDYNPMVSDEMLIPLGELNEENTYVLVTLTAMPKKEDTTVNLKAPIVINTETKRGCQLIVDDDYPVKFRIYEALKEKKEKEGE